MSWKLAYAEKNGRTVMQHLDGVAWHEAPVPRRWHRCRPQTRGALNWFTLIERCACGASRLDGDGRWMERNSRSRRG